MDSFNDDIENVPLIGFVFSDHHLGFLPPVICDWTQDLIPPLPWFIQSRLPGTLLGVALTRLSSTHLSVSTSPSAFPTRPSSRPAVGPPCSRSSLPCARRWGRVTHTASVPVPSEPVPSSLPSCLGTEHSFLGTQGCSLEPCPGIKTVPAKAARSGPGVAFGVGRANFVHLFRHQEGTSPVLRFLPTG